LEPVIVPGHGRLAESNRNAIYETFYDLAVVLLMNFKHVEIGAHHHIPENEIWLWMGSLEPSQAVMGEGWTRTTLERHILAHGLERGCKVTTGDLKEMQNLIQLAYDDSWR
jgi:hypothetical protein